MPVYEFTENDLFHNVIEAHPKIEFLIHDRKLYYNGEIPESTSQEPGHNVTHVPSGFLSLYEINVDRREDEHDELQPTMTYPFITKDGAAMAFKTVSTTAFQSFSYGDVMTGSYPLSASLSIERYIEEDPSVDDQFFDVCGKDRPRIIALKNTLNYYKTMSPHFAVESEFGNKMEQDLTLVSVPSIFYGSSIERGTVQMDYYLSGALAGRLEDVNQNGELIQTAPEDSPGLGQVAGVVLYNEGFILLTGDWSLNDDVEERYNYCPDPINAANSPDNPRWIYWGTQGYNNSDGTSADPDWLDPSTAVIESSYYLSMNGTNYIPTITMLAHAKKGELNHSNNPTYLTNGQSDVMMLYSGAHNFTEKDDLEIKNTVFSPYADPDAEFKKQTWISKIGIYDENRNLIAIAKLARPVLKTEDREFTFKLKLDF